ncbi:hypothetical protein [Virgisporangium aurantiacum]|uniref:Uncharacterized protein n=1 Tax=Virgisporangium aurantiacum TaxID=175570 RepID=A0A8J4E2W2_9ACTN|nr:hypothetical protein [Virgisporangium aurantiacum]GIJ59411.1 hypothetical protein Vau01_069270 [Virgisporangium aurantiacum]
MRPTSDARDDTEDRDPYDAEPVRSDPWASGPGHLTQDEPTERYVPEQRDADHDSGHDGHLYASDTYAEPETEVLTGQEHAKDGFHDNAAEPTAVGVAHVDKDDADTDAADTDAADTDAADKDADAKADEAEAKADDARETAEEAKAEAHADATDEADAHEPAENHPDDEVGWDHEPEVETVALPPAATVAVVEPVTDRPGDLTAVPVEHADDGYHENATEGFHENAEEPADEEPAGDLKPGDVPVAPVAGFLTADAAQGLRDRWREAQFGFVDDPRKAVEDVKALVSEAVDQFTAALSAQRDDLDAAAGEDTEQYRVAVQRYRTFFDRLLDL